MIKSVGGGNDIRADGNKTAKTKHDEHNKHRARAVGSSKARCGLPKYFSPFELNVVNLVSLGGSQCGTYARIVYECLDNAKKHLRVFLDVRRTAELSHLQARQQVPGGGGEGALEAMMSTMRKRQLRLFLLDLASLFAN